MANDTEALRKDLGKFRAYLILLAESKLSPALRAKISSSDVVQETLMQAHQQLDQFQGQTDAELATWLRTILLRQLIDMLRKYRSQARNVLKERALEAEADASSHQLERWLATEESSPSRLMMHEEQLLQLARAMELLPEDQRIAVDLKHLQGWSVEQISQHMGKSEAAIAGLLRRGMRQMREILQAAE